MKSAGFGFLVCLTLGGLPAAAADEWTIDLRVGGGDVSSDLVRATEFVLEFPQERFIFEDRLEYDVSQIRLTTLELRRFWSPRWVPSLRARYSVLELDETSESIVLVENTETGEIENYETSLTGIVTNDAGRVEAIELALGVEFHPAPRGRVDPFVGVSIGTVAFQGQPENQLFVGELKGDLGFGATAGLNVDLIARSYFVAAARWDSLEADPFRSLGPEATVVVLDDRLTTTTLELGVGVRFGSGGD